MKKYIYILSALLFGVVSCTEKVPSFVEDGEEKVTIDMTVSFPDLATKAGERGDNPSIDNIYVAVFGSKGYLNDYARAIPVGNYASTNGDDNYSFKVTLLATTSERTIHIIANGPDHLDYQTQAKDLMLGEALMSSDNKAGYWQTFKVKGTAKLVGGKWVASDDAQTKFNSIRLIRNFARVKVESNASNFELIGFKVYNTQKYGSFAMPMDESGNSFVDVNEYVKTDYSKTDYPTPIDYITESLGYSGYVPDTAKELIDNEAPKVGDVFGTGYQYVYESPNTENNLPYIIVAGKYKGGAVSYYKIEFVDDEGTHIPILRNMDYTITLSAIAKNGTADPKDAVTSNGNVSTTAATLSEISDGISGLYVLYTDRTYVIADKTDATEQEKEQTVSFQYQYIPDLNANKTATNYYKQAEIVEVSGDAIVGTPSQGAIDGGWYPVTIKVKKSSEAATAGKDLVSTFKVRGTSNTGAKLFRIITIRVIPTPSYVEASTGVSGMVYNLGLPVNLPSSMFPLDFYVYDSNQCVNPSGTDMPAISDPANKQFYYVKSVSATEYESAKNGNVAVIPLNFKKVKAGTTTITVKNQYFADSSDDMTVN